MKMKKPLKDDSKARIARAARTMADMTNEQALIEYMEAMTGLEYADVAKGVAELTPREIEVFDLMGLGSKNRQIAEKLGISVKTLDIHRINIHRKIGIRTGNAFGRVYWMYRVINEAFPGMVEKAREQKANRE